MNMKEKFVNFLRERSKEHILNDYKHIYTEEFFEKTSPEKFLTCGHPWWTDNNQEWRNLSEEWKNIVGKNRTANMRDTVTHVQPKPTETQIGGNHYKDFVIQPIEFIHKNNLSFIQGNIIKYICRYKNKNGKQDLEKVKHYVDLLIEMEGYDKQ